MLTGLHCTSRGAGKRGVSGCVLGAWLPSAPSHGGIAIGDCVTAMNVAQRAACGKNAVLAQEQNKPMEIQNSVG